MAATTTTSITTQINRTYGATARNAHSSTSPNNNDAATNIATAFGYAASDLLSLPEGANLGLSCGNPLALASLRPGETVIDLGSGGGFDVFLAARQVGATGLAIGIDQNPDMLALAERNRVKGRYENVKFIDSPITRIAGVADGTVDCVVSNCVINLVPAQEKYRVFEEMARVLKPGGRVAVSDLLARKELPREMREDVAAYVGCIAGAALVEEYEGWLKGAGFDDVMIVDAGQDCNQYKRCGEMDGGRDGCCSAAAAPVVAPVVEAEKKEEKKTGGCCGGKKVVEQQKIENEEKQQQQQPKMSKITEEADLNEWIGSFKVYAVKK